MTEQQKQQNKTYDAIIIARTWCHDFKIGTKVKATESSINPGVYEIIDEKGNYDYAKGNEIKPA